MYDNAHELRQLAADIIEFHPAIVTGAVAQLVHAVAHYFGDEIVDGRYIRSADGVPPFDPDLDLIATIEEGLPSSTRKEA